jgi:autotransporter-associated beta strand protein
VGDDTSTIQVERGNSIVVGSKNESTTYPGVISGEGALTKVGMATLTLGGANTFSGDARVASGVLKLGNPLALQAATLAWLSTDSGTLDYNNASFTLGGIRGDRNLDLSASPAITLTIAGSTSNTYSGTLSGSVNLLKTGDGTQALTGLNAFTGKTTITGGVLSANTLADAGAPSSLGSPSGANAVIDLGPGALRYTGGAASTNRAINLTGDGTIINNATGGPLTLNGVISGSGGLTLNGTGTLVLPVLNTYAGKTAIKGGVVSVNTLTDAGTPSSLGNPPAGDPIADIDLGPGTLRYTGGPTSTNRVINLTGNGTLENNVSGGALVLSGGISGTGDLTLQGTGQGVLSAPVGAGVASLRKAGPGAWTVGTSSPLGQLMVTGGSLDLSSDVTVGMARVNGGTIKTQGNSLIVTGSLATSGTYITNSGGGPSQFLVQGSDLGNDAATRTVTLSDATVTIKAGGAPVDGAALWLDAANPGSVQLTGGLVTRWNDSFGGAGNVAQTDPNRQPTYVLSGINGLPVVHFSAAGTADQLFNQTNYASPVTVFSVSRLTGGSNQRLITSYSNNWLLGYHGNLTDRAYFEGWVFDGAGRGADTQPHMYEATIPGAGQNSTFYVYDAARPTITQLASNQNGVQGPNGLSLGGWQAAMTEASDGDVGEVLIYNRILTDNERAQVETYLAAKWWAGAAGATGVNLPNTHVRAAGVSVLDLGNAAQNHLIGDLLLSSGASLTLQNATGLSVRDLRNSTGAGPAAIISAAPMPLTVRGKVEPAGQISLLSTSLTLGLGATAVFNLTAPPTSTYEQVSLGGEGVDLTAAGDLTVLFPAGAGAIDRGVYHLFTNIYPGYINGMFPNTTIAGEDVGAPPGYKWVDQDPITAGLQWIGYSKIYQGTNPDGTTFTYTAVDVELDTAGTFVVGLWTNGSGNGKWNTDGNWDPAKPGAAGDTAKFDKSAGSPDGGTVTVDAAKSVGTLVLNSTNAAPAKNFTLVGSAALTLDDGTRSAHINVTGGSQTLNVPLELNSNLTISAAEGTTLKLPNDLNEGVPGRTITLDGLGTVVLSGTNHVTGTLTVSKGKLDILAGSAVGPGADLVIGAEGQVEFAVDLIFGAGSSVAARHVPAIEVTAVPEPGTLALVIVGLMAAAGIWLRRRS